VVKTELTLIKDQNANFASQLVSKQKEENSASPRINQELSKF
jgi:hypothetical protein